MIQSGRWLRIVRPRTFARVAATVRQLHILPGVRAAPDERADVVNARLVPRDRAMTDATDAVIAGVHPIKRDVVVASGMVGALPVTPWRMPSPVRTVCGQHAPEKEKHQGEQQRRAIHGASITRSA